MSAKARATVGMVAANLKPNVPSSFSRSRLLGWLLVIVLVVYGLFSAPFPDEYGLAEVVIALLLVTIVVIQVPALLCDVKGGRYPLCLVPFAWLIVAPSIIGVLRWEIGDIVRDVIPLFYFFLPLFLLEWAKKNAASSFVMVYLVPAMIVAGSGFALRYFTSQGIGFAELGAGVFLINLKYYSYDPAVTFTAVFGLLFALTLMRQASLIKYPAVILYLGASLLAAGSLGGIGQRAPLAILALSLIIFGLKYSSRSLRPAIFSTILLLVIAFYLRDVLSSIYSILSEKTDAVGVNGKFEEIELIASILFSSWDKTLFGLGWGGVYYNPIVEGQIRFAHSIIGFYLLKSGIVGLAFVSMYVYWLASMYWTVASYAWRKDTTQLPLVFAVGSAPVIALLQPTYKTLSFGIILALIPAIYFYVNLHNRRGLN